MIGQEAGAKFAPLRPMRRSRIFCKEPTFEMIEWFYETENISVIHYEVIDDRTAIVYVVERIDKYQLSKSFTIGRSQRDHIYRNYTFYHPEPHSI